MPNNNTRHWEGWLGLPFYTGGSWRASLPSAAFEDVVDKVLNWFLVMLKEVELYTDLDVLPGELYYVDYYRKTIVLLFPLKTGRKPLYHAVVIHYTERKWYTPPSKAKEHYYSACNALHNFLKKGRVKEWMVKDRTIILIGPTYTKGVRGVVKRVYGKVMFACWVIKRVFELTNILKRVWGVLYNYFLARLRGFKRVFEEKGIEPFGEVKEFIERLRIYVRMLGRA